MTQYVSLINTNRQPIKAGGYQILSFTDESSDDHGMHAGHSSLIYPSATGLGCLELNVMWDPGNYTELRDVFVRDPFGVTKDPKNYTGYDHRAKSPGGQCFTKQHWLNVKVGTPLSVYVAHDSKGLEHVSHAQLKLVIL